MTTRNKHNLSGSSVTVTQRFYYSAYPILGCYSQFPLLDISRYWLLHNVSYTRRIQWKVLLAFLLRHSITRHFNYSTFQRSRQQRRARYGGLSIVFHEFSTVGENSQRGESRPLAPVHEEFGVVASNYSMSNVNQLSSLRLGSSSAVSFSNIDDHPLSAVKITICLM